VQLGDDIDRMHDPTDNTDMRPNSREFQQLRLSNEPDLPEILDCVLNITKSQTRTYLALFRNQDSDIRTLADELNRSGNTVREYMTILQEKGLVIRDERITEDGRYYTYEALSQDTAISVLHKSLTHWVAYVTKRIDHLAENTIPDQPMYRSATATASMSNGNQQISTEETSDEMPSRQCIMSCVFGLRDPLLELYLLLLNHPRSTAQELAGIRDFARSTIAGRLNDLQDRGLARPAGREVETGNHMAYEYIPRPLDEVKSTMKNQLRENWLEHARDCIDEFDLSSVDYR